MKAVPLYFLAFCLLSACTSTRSKPFTEEELQGSSLAFRHVSVLPMTEEAVRADQTVWILNHKIHQIGPEGTVELPVGTREIDGTGSYLLPGLAEMHAHIPQQNRALMEETLFLYLSQGITTIRGMLGHPDHLVLREDVRSGNIGGPQIFTAGPSLNGTSAPDIATATQMVQDQQAAGYDFLKLHPGLSRTVFDAIVATAREVGIPYSGHISAEVGIHHALASDYASIDHLDRYLDGLIPPSAGLDPAENGFFGLNYTDQMDPAGIEALARETQKAGVWNVPTMSMLVRWVGPVSADELAAAPEMQYMNPQTVDNWKKGKFSMTSYESWNPERVERFFTLRRQMLKALQEAGAGILLGSDAPQVFNVPGFSIHHELAEMVASGLTPYEALRSGTALPALFFGQQGAFGTLEPGAAADLILVRANPLEEVSHLRNPLGVMVKGQWLDQATLEAGLAKIAARYAGN